jgi:hypothetical protein
MLSGKIAFRWNLFAAPAFSDDREEGVERDAQGVA